MFFSFDGVDGVGKSTQVDLFCRWLGQQGRDLVRCRDPGSTELGEAVRRILLDGFSIPIHRRSEMLLYMAARAQLVDQIIRPALAAGKTVVCDRFLLANVVYQGYAGGLNVEQLWNVGRIATDGLSPDLTILLDMDVRQARQRVTREPDRMESQGIEFLERVRQGFLAESQCQNERIVVIDAARGIDAVQADVQAVAAHLLAPKGAEA